MASEMRNRLVELVQEAHYKWTYSMDNFENVCADHLIENGVVVPPVRMGDTVYCIFRNRETLELYVEDKTVCGIAIYENGMHIYTSPIISYCEFEFGVRIFLTKSEAEQKLKEMRGK